MKQYRYSLSSLLVFSLFYLHWPTTSAQSPTQAPTALPVPTPPLPVVAPPLAASKTPPLPIVAPPLAASKTPPLVSAGTPGPPGPTNVTKILAKAGGFSVLIRLLKSTSEGIRITTLLNDSSQGITILAPNDRAFAKLKPGTMNSLSDEQKSKLVQFHVLPTFLSLSHFQTLSNPVPTDVGQDYEYPLNITTSPNSVNLTSGLVNTSISDTVYTDNQLAIYEIDSVLKPFGIFSPKKVARAPAPEKQKKKGDVIADSPDSESVPKDDAAGGVRRVGSMVVGSIGVGVALIGAFIL